MLRLRKTALALLPLCFCLSYGYSAKATNAAATHAVFYKATAAGPDSAIIEVYWQIDAASLHYGSPEGSTLFQATVRTQLRIRRLGDTGIVAEEQYYFQTRPIAKSETAHQTLLEGQRFVLPQGTYLIELLLSDARNAGADYNYTDSVSAIAGAKPFYSTPQLLDTVFQNTAASPFLKAGRQQFPSTTNFLDEGKTILQSYSELYHTEALPQSAFPLKQRTFITSKNSEIALPGFRIVDTIRSGAVMASYLHDFNTESLPGGNYYLRTTLWDKDNNELASASTFYQSLNKHPKIAGVVQKPSVPDSNASPVEQVSVLDLSKTFIAKYTPAQLRAMLKMINPVAKADQRAAIQGFLKKPDEVYMRYFLYNFFLERNAKDASAAWKAYADTVRLANKQFSSGSTLGYETDRGAILMRYGQPLERIPVPNENGAAPYEIWTYNDLAGRSELAVFLFYQPGFVAGDMLLLHSTIPGEVRNIGWRSKLYKSGAAANSNSRAEEYLGQR